jgi:hypothetical protein
MGIANGNIKVQQMKRNFSQTMLPQEEEEEDDDE